MAHFIVALVVVRTIALLLGMKALHVVVLAFAFGWPAGRFLRFALGIVRPKNKIFWELTLEKYVPAGFPLRYRWYRLVDRFARWATRHADTCELCKRYAPLSRCHRLHRANSDGTRDETCGMLICDVCQVDE